MWSSAKMPFLLMVLVVAAAGWLWLDRGGLGARTLLGAVESLRQAARRLGLAGPGHLHPVDRVTDPRVLTAMIAMAFVELDGPPRRAQVAKISASLAQNNLITLDDSDDLVILAGWLLGQCGGAGPAIARGVRRLHGLRGAEDLAGLMDLLQDGVLAGSGSLSPRQKQALTKIASGLRP